MRDLYFPWNAAGRHGRSGCEGNPAAGFEFRGFHAVAFRRGAEDEDADTHPFALVVWTDAQVLPDPGAAGFDPDELVVSRTRSFRVTVADGALVREVPTVPAASEGDDYEAGIDGLDHPCLDAGGDVADRKVGCLGGGAAVPCANHPEERYSGAALWRFAPEEAPADAGVASFRLVLDSRDAPRLVLLPDFVLHELDAEGALMLDEAGEPVVLLRAEDL